MAFTNGTEPAEPGVEPEIESEDDDAAAAEPQAPPAPAPAAPGADLLSVFQSSQVETEDLSTIVGLAQEVEIGDLLEEMQTVVAALRRRLETATA